MNRDYTPSSLTRYSPLQDRLEWAWGHINARHDSRQEDTFGRFLSKQGYRAVFPCQPYSAEKCSLWLEVGSVTMEFTLTATGWGKKTTKTCRKLNQAFRRHGIFVRK